MEATWEAEIRRIKVRGKPRQILYKSPSPKITRKNGLEVWLK
jgi:hypothetical protein